MLGQWETLRNQAIDKIDVALQKRSGEPWKDQERKQKEEEKATKQLEFERRMCPDTLAQAKLKIKQVNAKLKELSAKL